MSTDKNDKNKDDQYRDTVFLPKTDFPMRANLPENEPKTLKKWQDSDLYARQREASKGREKWILHWGPPYANGRAHMGHAFTKSLKDVVNRSWQMLGYDAPLVPGWDCHGLPIEWKIEEKYREAQKNKDDVDILTFRQECREFAMQWVKAQTEDFERLGVLGDFKNPYLTMTNHAEAQIVREIHKFLNNGGLYRGVKPVMWSPVEKTALAEAEVEYHEHKSITVWVKFPIKNTKLAVMKDASVVIWTTTPWTLPSNRAIAFGKDIEYGVYEYDGQKIVVAVSLAESVKEKAQIENWEQVTTFKGSEIEGTVCHHPLYGHPKLSSRTSSPSVIPSERSDEGSQDINGDSSRVLGMTGVETPGYDFDVPLLAGDFVTEEAGTGFVHMAPGHGEDDYYLYVQHFGAKEIPDNVTDDGKFRDHVPLFGGEVIYDDKGEMGGGNFSVLRELNEAGALLAKGSIRHEYPHSWRSKTPVIFRTTPQWFISMEENHLRKKALHEIKKTKWVPEKGQARITAMIENRPDWCISRQRAWGVPIALFVHKEKEEILRDDNVLKRIAETFEKEGSDAWWARPASDFLGPDYNAEEFEQIFDIVDVWFESGSTHAFVCEDREELQSPADLYLEGSDQHRGWFHSSLLESCGTRGHAPYKTVLTHGFVLDEKGYKMSKSQGNVVDPADIIKEYGADILRLWAMTSDYAEDIRISKDALKNAADLYRRIRNTLRFLLGALDGFDEAERVDLSDLTKLPELEQLVLHQLHEMDQKMRGFIEGYQFGRMTKALHEFCNGELSSFYFDIRKDRLYCDAPDLFERRASRTVMAEIFNCLSAWLAPILCFTAEEAWQHRPEGVFEDTDSVHLREFPKVPKVWKNDALAEKWEKVHLFRTIIFEKLEQMRKEKIIGSSLEAAVTAHIHSDHQKQLQGIDWEEVCIVSQAKVLFESESFLEGKAISWNSEKARGCKCHRCWKVLPEVKEDTGLCNRCTDAVEQFRKAA